jgi:hypothetical protein
VYSAPLRVKAACTGPVSGALAFGAWSPICRDQNLSLPLNATAFTEPEASSDRFHLATNMKETRSRKSSYRQSIPGASFSETWPWPPARRITSAKRPDNAVQAHYDCPRKQGKRIPIAKIADFGAISTTEMCSPRPLLTNRSDDHGQDGRVAACVSQRADSSIERMRVIASPCATKPAPSALR